MGFRNSQHLSNISPYGNVTAGHSHGVPSGGMSRQLKITVFQEWHGYPWTQHPINTISGWWFGIPSGYDQHSHGKSPFFKTVNPGKPSINGPFSMAMLNNQRVRLLRPTPGNITIKHGLICSTSNSGSWNSHWSAWWYKNTIWLVVLTILKNMKVNGKDYPIYYGK